MLPGLSALPVPMAVLSGDWRFFLVHHVLAQIAILGEFPEAFVVFLLTRIVSGSSRFAENLADTKAATRRL